MEIVQSRFQDKALVGFDLGFPVDTGSHGAISCAHVEVHLAPYWFDYFDGGLNGLPRDMLFSGQEIFRPYAHNNLLLRILLDNRCLLGGKVYTETLRLKG